MTSKRYECNLDPELLQKAVSELNEPESNVKRLEEIDKLRNRFLTEQQEFDLLRSDDSFILRFLRAKKFNQDKAFQTLINYHRKRHEIREVYDKVDDPKSLSKIIERGSLMPIKQKARDGSTVIVNRPGFNWSDDATLCDGVAVGVLIVESLLEDESVQINGITEIDDYTHAGLNLVKLFSPSTMRRLKGIIVGTIPLRVKAIHMVNEYKIFSVLYAITKPFMKEKIKKRMKMHGQNLSSLHEEIDPSGLPSFLGGTGPDLDVAGWKARLLSTTGHGEETNL